MGHKPSCFPTRAQDTITLRSQGETAASRKQDLYFIAGSVLAYTQNTAIKEGNNRFQFLAHRYIPKLPGTLQNHQTKEATGTNLPQSVSWKGSSSQPSLPSKDSPIHGLLIAEKSLPAKYQSLLSYTACPNPSQWQALAEKAVPGLFSENSLSWEGGNPYPLIKKLRGQYTGKSAHQALFHLHKGSSGPAIKHKIWVQWFSRHSMPSAASSSRMSGNLQP